MDIEKLGRAASRIRKAMEAFFNSVPFIWFVAAMTLVFWVTNQELGGLIVIILLVTAILFVCSDATPTITCLIFLFFVFSDTELSFAGRELWLIMLVLPIAGFIYNAVRYKAERFRVGGYSFANLLVTIPWLFQGVTRSGRSSLTALLFVGIGVLFVLVFFGISVCSRREKGLTDYMIKILLALGVLVFIQVLIYYFKKGDYKFDYDYVNLGWGSRNPASTVLALTIPSSFYFATKKGKLNFLFVIWGSLQFVLILLLKSRGVTIVAAVAMLAMYIYTPIKADNKRGVLILEAVFIISAIGVTVFALEKLKSLFSRFLYAGFDGLGRTDLYAEGWRVFKRFPVFGAGFDYKVDLYYKLIPTAKGPVYYHSTVIQIMACFGVVGMLFYAYLYYWRYRIALTDVNPLKFFLLVGMLIVEGYGFMDTLYFQPMAYFILMMISLCMEKELPKDKAIPLPIRFAKYAKGATQKN